MIWVAWRQQRMQLTVSAIVVAAVAAVVVLVRFDAAAHLRDNGLEHCLGSAEGACSAIAIAAFHDRYRDYVDYLVVALELLPLVLGMFAGAPLFAREFEQGTHVFAQAQSVGRTRWLVTKLLVGGLPVIVAMAALSGVTAWGMRPFSVGGDITDGRLASPFFETQGLVVAAYALVALAIGAAAGLLFRNTVVAMALTIGCYVLLVVGAGELRPSYVAPVEQRYTLQAHADAVRGGVPYGAVLVGYRYLDGAGTEVAVDEFSCTSSGETFESCARRHGVVGVGVRFHPDERFWDFQLIESGLALAVSAGLLGMGLWGLYRRPS